MRTRLYRILGSVVVLTLASTVAARQEAESPKQDLKLLRFAERALPWYPDSSFTITEDERKQTASGSYRLVSVDRSCDSKYLAGVRPLVIDEMTSQVWIGNRGKLPTADGAFDPSNLRRVVEHLIPDLLLSSNRIKAKVDWKTDLRPGGVIPFTLVVDSGYGEYRKLGAVTADGKYLILGSPLPFDRDPVEYRRDMLRTSPQVVWDEPSSEARAEIVEFSDFECPGCRAKWSLIKKSLDTFGSLVQHGYVAFPLNTIHPWAFRSACAGWCVAQKKPELLVPLKELFYSMQEEMAVSLVTPTAKDFVAAEGLDEEEFLACYLRQPSLDGVHEQLTLGNRLGVMATPTFFINGWMVVVPEEAWLMPMLERLTAGEEP